MYIQAAFPNIHTLLVKAEETSNDVRNVVLSASEQAFSVQLYYTLALLTKNWAMDKVQAAGEGEGLAAWRGLQEQWEPKSRSRSTSMLLGILNGRFKGDAQNDIESWERDIRSFEKQTSFAIPDFVKAGILIHGLQEEPGRWHVVLHTSRLDTNEKLRLEVTEIARVKVMTVNPVPMEVDALRFKGKGKGKCKDHKEKGKANKEKGAHGKSPDTKEMECHYSGMKGHKKSDCLRRKADLEKAKAEGRPAVPSQAVHAVTHEVGYPSSSSAGDEVRSSGGSAGISVNQDRAGRGGLHLGARLGAEKAPPERHHAGLRCGGERLPCGLLPGVWHPVGPAHRVAGGRRLPGRALRFQGCLLPSGLRGDEGALRGGVCEGSDLELEDAGWRLGHQGGMSTRVRRSAVEELASPQQASTKLHVEAWAGLLRNQGLRFSQEEEIVPGCAVAVACPSCPDNSP